MPRLQLSSTTPGVVVNFVGVTGNTVDVPAGTTQVDILLTVVDDILAEPQEHVYFSLLAGAGYIPNSGNSFIDIDDNDTAVTPSVSVAATDNSADEGNAATDTGEYTISFSQTPNIASTTLNFTMSGGASTVGGTDYNLSSPTTGVAISYTGPTGTITVPAGTPSVVVILTAVNDALTGCLGQSDFCNLRSRSCLFLAACFDGNSGCFQTSTERCAHGSVAHGADQTLTVALFC